MSKYDAYYFVGDNQAINRVRVVSSKTRNRGVFSGSLAALVSRVLKLNGIWYFVKLPQIWLKLTINFREPYFKA